MKAELEADHPMEAWSVPNSGLVCVEKATECSTYHPEFFDRSDRKELATPWIPSVVIEYQGCFGDPD